MIQSTQLTGILWMLFHCFLIALTSAMVVQVSDAFHIFQILFVYNAVAFLMLVVFMLLTKRYAAVKTTKLKLHISRAVLAVISLAMYFYAITVIPLTEARAIALSGPLVSSLGAILFLKEKTGRLRTVALISGFIGALIIIRPGAMGFSSVSLLVMAAVLMWAVIDVIIKLMSKTESNTTQLFYLTGLMALLSLPLAIFVWKTPETIAQSLWLAAIGAVFLINVIAVYNAFKYADITAIMPFDFSGMIFTIIIAYLAFGEVINLPTTIGAVIIMFSSIYLAKREAIKAKEVHAVALKSEM